MARFLWVGQELGGRVIGFDGIRENDLIIYLLHKECIRLMGGDLYRREEIYLRIRMNRGFTTCYNEKSSTILIHK